MLCFSVQDATSLPQAPESFGAVVIANALHILPGPEFAAYIKAHNETFDIVLSLNGFHASPDIMCPLETLYYSRLCSRFWDWR